jgi:hypothetical protein
MTARRHHYVSQCYLKVFAPDRDKPKLFVIDLKEHRCFGRTSPTNVAAERDFHRIEADGLPPDALEMMFSDFESDLSQALDRVIASRSIANEDDRALLLNFIGLCAVKSPSHREGLRSVHEQIAKRILLLATETRERWESQILLAKQNGELADDADPDYERVRDFIRRDRYTINLGTPYHLDVEMQAFDSILPYIFGRKWILVKAPLNTTGFITSDHPVCLISAELAKRGGSSRPGLGCKRTHLVFPISNELAMIGAFEFADREIDADKLFMAQINGVIVAHAQRQIYARDNDFVYRMPHNNRIRHGAELLNEEHLRD